MQACFSATALSPGCQTKPLGFLIIAGVSLLDIFFSLPRSHRRPMDHEHICEMISRFKVFYYCRIMCIHKRQDRLAFNQLLSFSAFLLISHPSLDH